MRELLKADAAIAVGVSLPDHAGELVGGESVAEAGHGVGQLGGGDEAVAVSVEHPEELPQLLLRVRGLGREELGGHQGHELRELDEAVVVGVGLVDEGLQLVGARLQPQRPQKGAQLQLRQASVVVPIERTEYLPQLRYLLVVQVHCFLLLLLFLVAAHSFL